MKKCAYCKQERDLTREHIWSSCLIKRQGDLLTFNKQQDKFYKGEPVIKDVCSDCNNIKLSNLDTYLSSLYDEHFCSYINAGDAALLNYNYDMLLRSLLKISYNSARAHNENINNIKQHEKLSKYILGYSERPKQLMLRLQIVTSAKRIRLDTGEEKIVYPEGFRCGDVSHDGGLSRFSHRFMICMVAINSYWFYILAPYGLVTKSKYEEFLKEFKRCQLHGVRVSPHTSQLTIPVEKTTYMHDALYESMGSAAKKYKAKN